MKNLTVAFWLEEKKKKKKRKKEEEEEEEDDIFEIGIKLINWNSCNFVLPLKITTGTL